jgi:TIR domain
MKVFLSWSGSTSRAVALALRSWLPTVLQIVEPYVSSEDIEKGARWSVEIAQQLNDTAFGIICITKSNVGSPWLNFEAGALSKSVDTSRVSPFLLDLRPTDLVGPMAQFQATLPRFDDVTRLLASINSATERPIDEVRLSKVVEKWWPELDEQLTVIRSEQPLADRRPQREATDMIEELLEISRSIQRRLLHGGTGAAPQDESANVASVTLAVESLTLAKLEAAFSATHDVASDIRLFIDGQPVLVDAIIAPREAIGESYLIDIQYISTPGILLNRMLKGVARLSKARRAYEHRASGPLNCVILYVVANHNKSLMDDLNSQLGAMPEDINALSVNESELRQIAPTDLRQRLTAVAG